MAFGAVNSAMPIKRPPTTVMTISTACITYQYSGNTSGPIRCCIGR